MTLRWFRLGALVAACIGLGGWTCPPEDEVFLLHAPDAATQLLVDQCVQPGHDCLPLCEKLTGLGPSQILHCEIHPQTDPEFIQVHVGVEGFCGGGCE